MGLTLTEKILKAHLVEGEMKKGKEEVYICFDIVFYIDTYIKLYRAVYLFIPSDINKYMEWYNLIYQLI